MPTGLPRVRRTQTLGGAGAGAALFALLCCVLSGVQASGQPVPLDPLEFQLNTYTTGLQFPGEVTIDPRGNFVVVWISNGSSGSDTSGRSIQARRYARDGLALDGAEFQVNTYTLGNQVSPSVASDAEGNFVVVWESPFSSGPDQELESIQGRRFAPDGTPLGAADFEVNTYTTDAQKRPAVAMEADGRFVVVWDSIGSPGNDDQGYSVLVRRFAADGTPLDATDLQVNTLTLLNQKRPQVRSDGQGHFVVVWDGLGYIWARRYDFDAGPLDTSEFQVNSESSFYQYGASLAVQPRGDFVVAWSSWGSAGSDTSYTSVQARRFHAEGTPEDATQFQVNTYTVDYQNFAALTSGSEGDFVVAWTSWDPAAGDPSYGGIQGRRFRSDGSPVDATEGLANTYTTSWQSRPAVAVEPGGDYLLVWESNGSWEGDPFYSVEGRRFGPPRIVVATSSGGTGGPDCTLRDAISAAGTSLPAGACPAGSGGAVIELPPGVTISLAEEDNPGNGLPRIERPVTIRGGGSVIERAAALPCPGSPEFRIFDVAPGAVLTLESVVVRGGCVPGGSGGGVRATDGTVVLRNATIEGNRSGLGGGGLAIVDSNLLTLDSTLRANLDLTTGGGIAIAGNSVSARIDRSTFSGNASWYGGAVSVEGTANLRVSNSTFEGNWAALAGGAVFVEDPSGSAHLEFSTVTGNSAPAGAGVAAVVGEVSLHGSLVGGSSSGSDCAVEGGAITATGANLDTDGTCALLAGSAVTTVADLGLEALGDRGGPTWTRLPRRGSPALDAAPACAFASTAALVRDQRGEQRPTDDDGDSLAECELGAVERGPLFSDGFESGDLSRWSFSLPGSLGTPRHRN